MMEGGGGEKETPGKMCAATSRGAGSERPHEEDSRELKSKQVKRESEGNIYVTGLAPGGSAGTVNTAGVVHGGMGNINITITGADPLHDILVRTKDEVECMTAGMVRVSAVDVVVNMLSSGQHWVTITGNAGDGKSTLGYLVLKEFQKKDVGVYTLYKPEEYDLVSKIKEVMVIMLDDRFGAFRADEQKVDKWFDVIQRIFRCQKNKANTRVIFISRLNVVNESKDYLGHLTDNVFNRKVVVDLSKRTSTCERMKILEHHLGHENVSMHPDIVKRVCTTRVAHGFPHCCKMIARFISKGYDVPIEQFFRSPLDFLDKTTKVLYKGKCKDLFQIMIKHDGKFDFNNINDEEKRQKLLEVEKEQEGSYITVWRNGTCQFAHPSVYESVLNVINNIDPLYCVQYATLSVIRQKMIISTSDEEDRSRSPCYIIVKPIPAVLKALVERFREEILKGDYSVFKHRLCQSREFCEALVSCCVTTDERKNGSKQFINQPSDDGETMLCTAARNTRMAAVHCLVKADANVSIQDKRGRTPLHHLCRLKNSTDDEDDNLYPVDLDTLRLIINKGTGDVNICDQYGRTPLHYLCQIRNSISPAVKHNVDKLQNVVIEAMRLFIIEARGDVNIGDQYGQTPLHYLCQVGISAAAADGHYDDKLQDVVTNAMRLIIIEGSGDINNPDRFGKTPLHYLLKSCNFATEEIQWIITQGKGDLNKCEQHKSTPLHYLCANSDLQLDTVDLVIKEGKGDFNKGDEHGTTPFHYLCKSGKLELDVVLRIVNTAKGDINKQDDNGITPLHVLCKGSHPMENILTLINQGDKADRYGNSPLHFLCRRRGINAEVLQQQLEQHPETDMKKQNNLRYTPLDYLTDKASGAYELLLSCGNSVVSGTNCTMTCDTKDPAVTAVQWFNGSTTTTIETIDCTDAGDLPYEASCNKPGKFDLKITNAQYGRDSYAWFCTDPFDIDKKSNITDENTFVTVPLTISLMRTEKITCIAVSSPAATVTLYEVSPPSQDKVIATETNFSRTMDGLKTNLTSNTVEESKTYYCSAYNIFEQVNSTTSVPATTTPTTLPDTSQSTDSSTSQPTSDTSSSTTSVENTTAQPTSDTFSSTTSVENEITEASDESPFACESNCVEETRRLYLSVFLPVLILVAIDVVVLVSVVCNNRRQNKTA